MPDVTPTTPDTTSTVPTPTTVVTPPAAGTPPTGTGPSTSGPSLAQLQGTWKGVCEIESIGQSVAGSSQETLIFGAPSANGSVSVTAITNYYNTVSDCSGTPVATTTELPITLISNSTKTVSGLTAYNIVATTTGGTQTFSGSASIQTLGGNNCIAISLGTTATGRVTICESIETASRIIKFLIAPLANGTQFDLGGTDEDPRDADGFPISLLPEPEGRYTKQ